MTTSSSFDTRDTPSREGAEVERWEHDVRYEATKDEDGEDLLVIYDPTIGNEAWIASDTACRLGNTR